LEEIGHIETFQQYILNLKQRRMQKEKAKRDEKKMVEEILIKGNKTLAVLFIHISVGKLSRQIRFWPAKKFEFLYMIGNDKVARMTDQLEQFSMAIKKRWMVGLGVVARHSTVTVEEKEKGKQKKMKIRDKNKKRRRRNQMVKMDIG